MTNTYTRIRSRTASYSFVQASSSRGLLFITAHRPPPRRPPVVSSRRMSERKDPGRLIKTAARPARWVARVSPVLQIDHPGRSQELNPRDVESKEGGRRRERGRRAAEVPCSYLKEMCLAKWYWELL